MDDQESENRTQVNLYSVVIVRTSNVLKALVSSELVHFKQPSETVQTDCRVPDEIRERVPDCGASNRKNPTAVSVEPVTRYCKQLTVGGTQMPPSVSTGDWDAIVRQIQWIQHTTDMCIVYLCAVGLHLLTESVIIVIITA